MKTIGGFLGLELGLIKNEFHKGGIKLNSGRNALAYLLKERNYKKIFIPYYICDSVLDTIKKFNYKYEFYYLDKNFFPLFNKQLKLTDVLLYVNYFGINDKNVKNVARKYKNIIIDNSQAFFCPPIPDRDIFYSSRKFFGVPDGAYLYTKNNIKEKLLREESNNRIIYLLKRLEDDPKAHAYFLKNEKYIGEQSIKKMSYLSEEILKRVDYRKVIKIRRKNFLFLQKKLNSLNKLKISLAGSSCPMVYPFFTEIQDLRDFLIKNGIFVATYWNEVLDRVGKEKVECRFVKNLIPLPIDQRYGIKEMEIIVNKIKIYLKKK